MSDPLPGYRLKLNRAQEHFDALHAAIDAVVAASPDELITKLDSQANEHVFGINGGLDPLPSVFPLIIGDCLHNLRSSLDYLVYELSGRPAGEPSRQTAFPICDSPHAYFGTRGNPNRAASRKVSQVDSAAAAAIERLQPYNREDGNPHGDPLWLLSELSNEDKHRTLPVVRAYLLSMGAIDYVTQDDKFLFRREVPERTVAFEDSTDLFRLPIPPDIVAGYKMNVDTYVSFDVAFGDTIVSRGENVYGVLCLILRHIEDVVIPRLEPFIPPRA